MNITLDELKARAKQDLDDAFEKGKTQGGDNKKYFQTMWQSIVKSNNYIYGMAGRGINDETFCPSEDMVLPVNVSSFFAYSGFTNLKEIFEKANAVLDCSNVRLATSLFTYSTATELPVLDLSSGTSLNYAFSNMTNLRKMWGITFPTSPTATATQIFQNDTALEEIIVNGEIVVNGLDFHWSTSLIAESYHNIMTHLSKTATITLTLPAYETVKSVYDAKYGEGAWDDIVAEYGNVTIAYM
jgi:hypothetical protein